MTANKNTKFQKMVLLVINGLRVLFASRERCLENEGK